MSNESTANAQTAAPLAPSGLVNEALRLASLGYRVFPCLPGQKEPAISDWPNLATTDEDQIAAWWEQNPAYNIGLITSGLFVVDVDPIDGQPNPFLDDECCREDLLIYAAKTPRGGQHFFFRQADGMDLRNTVSAVATGVDTRANGGYVLVYPSKTEHGQYEWLPGYSLDVPAAKLPPPPLWLLKQLESAAARKSKLIDRNAQESAAIIPDGQRNSTLTSLGGYLRRAGMLETEIKAALRAANVQRCDPPLDDSEIDRIAWSVARYEPNQVTQALAEGWALQDAADATEVRTDRVSDPGPIPRELLQPGGFLQDVIDWNLATAYRPQPELALAAALALLSVLTGRKIQSETGIRTNLYILGICDSGGGKENARKCNKAILQAAGLDDMIGPEGIGSHQGIISSLREHPAQLFQVDEIGRLLATLANPSKSPHLYNVISVLLKLYTSSDSLYVGDAVADIKRVAKINQPHAVLYGTTVPNSFFQSMPKESLSDGFMGRLLVFEATNNRPTSQSCPWTNPPIPIIEYARWWKDWRNYHPAGGDLQDQNPNPRLLIRSQPAELIFAKFNSLADRESLLNRETAGLWTRSSEKAVKLALLHQVSLDRDAEQISETSARWGCEIASYLTRKMEFSCQDRIAENRYEATYNRVYLGIKAAGQNGLKLSDMGRNWRWINQRERDEVLQHMESAGDVRKTNSGPTGGRTAVKYVAV